MEGKRERERHSESVPSVQGIIGSDHKLLTLNRPSSQYTTNFQLPTLDHVTECNGGANDQSGDATLVSSQDVDLPGGTDLNHEVEVHEPISGRHRLEIASRHDIVSTQDGVCCPDVCHHNHSCSHDISHPIQKGAHQVAGSSESASHYEGAPDKAIAQLTDVSFKQRSMINDKLDTDELLSLLLDNETEAMWISEHFAAYVIPNERLFVLRLIPAGDTLKFVPYYDERLVRTCQVIAKRKTFYSSPGIKALFGNQPKIYVNREDMSSSWEGMVFYPINKAKTQHIAIQNKNVINLQQSFNSPKVKEIDVFHQHPQGCKLTGTLVESERELLQLPPKTQQLVESNDEGNSSQTSTLKKKHNPRRVKYRRPSAMRHTTHFGRANLARNSSHLPESSSKAVQETHSDSYSSKNVSFVNTKTSHKTTLKKDSSRHRQLLIKRPCPLRPADQVGKSGNSKASTFIMGSGRSSTRKSSVIGKVRVSSAVANSRLEIAQETYPGSSSLDFSRKFSVAKIINSLSETGHSLYRPAGVSRRNSVPRSLNRRSNSHPTSASGRQLTETHDSSASEFHHMNNPPLSGIRSIEEAVVHSRKEICTVTLPFSCEDITQLLHASDYSKIIQQVGHISHSLPPESFIPAQFIVGVSYFKLSNFKEAKKCFLQCQDVARSVHRDGDVMLCNAYLGDMEYASKSYVEATKCYKTAIEHYTAGSVALMFKLTPPTLSAINAKLASAFRNVSMMVQAIDHYRTAISKAKTDRDRLSAHTSLGNLYQSMGDNTSALREYKQSIELAESLGDQVSLGWAHGNIGNAYLGLNKKDEAVYHLHKSLDLAIEYECTPQAIGRTYNNLGTAYQSMNDLDKAEGYYEDAKNQAVYGNDKAGQARVYGNIGNVHMLRKNYERAIPYYSEVLELSTDPSTVSTARHNRGCAYYEWATFLQPNSTQKFESNIHGPDCNVDACLSKFSAKVKELYRKGCDDLHEVVKYHEERLQHIKGSSSGLTLSVSLFESNSRTFHRLQDCLVSLHRFEKALVVAEQSRARTLGELLLKRKREQLTKSLSSPLSFDQIAIIAENLKCPLIFFSYTGARLICWMFLSVSGKMTLNTFEVPLTDDQFDGKSFDYHLRYSLTEKLVERSFEMYQSIEYNSESSAEVQTLHKLIGKPMLTIFQCQGYKSPSFQQITTISDSYTSLLPLTCLLDPETKVFLGDYYYFNMAPSLLTMGIMKQFPSIVVECTGERHDFCIVGDPNIPSFYLNGELWSLGRLPYARREAEWVAHALKTAPILGDQATKGALLIRLMNAKVVHIATHGSASAGFLAFSALAVSAKSITSSQVDGSNVLLYPEEVEKLHISPALVVLSSCDSGRGTVKADGIQGMARAFILAGAQSVLTTLWKVPDESASVFMQFFYQYLMDGIQSSLALQKAILSVRCFAKYSQYIHWSGYQLTGRDIMFSSKPSVSALALKLRLGESSVFPRLSDIKKLEKALVNNPRLPTDVQILKGPTGVFPSEVVVDFITTFHKHFSAGVFWINCNQPELVQSSIDYVEKTLDLINLHLSEIDQALFVFDGLTQLSSVEPLLKILKSHHVHIIVLSGSYSLPDKLIKNVDHALIRGCVVHNIEPLTRIHSTQRIVFTVMKSFNFTPTNEDQQMLEQLAEFSTGSPPIIEVAAQVLLTCYKENQHKAASHITEMLSLTCTKNLTDTSAPSGHRYVVRAISENVVSELPNIAAMPHTHQDIWETDSTYDTWDSIAKLIDGCDLATEERFLLNCLSVFGCYPIPFSLVTKMSSLITQATRQVHLASTLLQKLLKYKFVKPYPLPVVLSPAITHHSSFETYELLEYVYIPQFYAQGLLKNMEKVDRVAALSVVYASISLLQQIKETSKSTLHGLCSHLLEMLGQNYSLVNLECYKSVYCLFLDTL